MAIVEHGTPSLEGIARPPGTRECKAVAIVHPERLKISGRGFAQLFWLAMTLAIPGTAAAKSLHPDYLLLRGEVQHYGDWLVGCDNSAACTMIGFPGEGGGMPDEEEARPIGIEISASGPAGSEVVVHLLPFDATTKGANSDQPARAFLLDPGVWREQAAPVHGFSRVRLSAEEATVVLQRLESGQPILGPAVTGGKSLARFPLKDFSRGFRAMLARRAQLLGQLDRDALVPRPLRRIAAMPVMVSGFVPIVTDNTCLNSSLLNLKRFRFQGDTDLWSYECADGNAPGKTFFAMSKGPGLHALPLDLPEPRLGKVAAGRDGLATAHVHFDWDFGVMRHYQFQSGREDCGTMRAWGYTSQGWYLIERREMPLCKGLEPGDWIRTHSMPLGGAGPDD